MRKQQDLRRIKGKQQESVEVQFRKGALFIWSLTNSYQQRKEPYHYSKAEFDRALFIFVGCNL